VLWATLRNRGLDGLKFRRQHPIGRFIADFCCLERRLIVEIDGPIHDAMVEQDTERTLILGAKRYKVIRFRNEEVFDDLETVLRRIKNAVNSPS
jgi:leucyl-tRNA synthetase